MTCRIAFVAGQVVQHNDISWSQFRDQHLGHERLEDIWANVAFVDGHAEFIQITRNSHRGNFGPGYHTDHGNVRRALLPP